MKGLQHDAVQIMRLSRRVAMINILVTVLSLAACDSNSRQDSAQPMATPPAALAKSKALQLSDQSTNNSFFSDIAADVGLNFHHYNGATGKYFFPEIVGAGCALLDYDGDGDLDVYLIQSGLIDAEAKSADLIVAPADETVLGNRLFRNDLSSGQGLVFADVTANAQVGDTGYGMGVTTGDYDNDGDMDMFVTNFGANVLYRNNGVGSFSDATEVATAGDAGWSTSAAFVDTDNDGDLDLFFANYVDYTISGDLPCEDSAGRRDYCSPSRYTPSNDRLLRNDGQKGFVDISESSGITSSAGPGLGVLATDTNNDGLVDIIVANDQHANFLWRNRGNNIFEEEGLISGIAYNADGKAEASMGVTAGDFDQDGDDDLFMTHLISETHTLYKNDGEIGYSDITTSSGFGPVSLRMTGFGARWFDYDSDGDLDLYVANGAVAIQNDRLGKSPYPYEQADQLFENVAGQSFQDVSEAAGLAAMPVHSGRGAAFGDIDNDGDVDVLVCNSNGPVMLLRNDFESSSLQLVFSLQGETSNRAALGARIGLQFQGGEMMWRRVHVDGSFASANDRRVHFAYSADNRPVAITVQWPGGAAEWWEPSKLERKITLVQGTGQSGLD